ncbi:hypothetical protein CROQUDRAFT_668664 [Cronartium quercuum f. sp. fusiforme G11]|uniref:Yeast cell wall synthesis Kre9/Knh1-like N-terminal domain-containing protein n=1 Tax=Cronartium quercuum f. sp. fusiforme G11 TaxID=708437 RepID=A0A9P6NVM9_9BASI|nr:hypothetical protein CROQUDRAFT_668664 [Cronartium quercuum f. sp. fusiforme G11]
MRYFKAISLVMACISLFGNCIGFGINPPPKGYTWKSDDETLQIGWTYDKTDPPNFDIAIKNDNTGFQRVLQTNVQSSTRSYLLPAEPNLESGTTFRVAFVSEVGFLFAQSDTFKIVSSNE